MAILVDARVSDPVDLPAQCSFRATKNFHSLSISILSLTILLLLNATTVAAPTTGEFINSFSRCALNLKVSVKGEIEGSIKSLYDGLQTKGDILLTQETNFIQLFPQEQRLKAYELYTICVRSSYRQTSFDPFFLQKIKLGVTSIDYIKQKIGSPSEIDDNYAVFYAGGYKFSFIYSMNGEKVDSKDGPTYSVRPGTVLAFSVSLNENEEQDALLLDGYWVYFGCSDEEPDCTRWGTRKLLGQPKMNELADGSCSVYATGRYVGFNSVPNRFVSVCPGSAGQEFRTAQFACDAYDKSLEDALSIVHVLYHEADLKEAKEEKDLERIKSIQETIDNVKSFIAFPRDKYEDIFNRSFNECKVVEYNIINSNVELDFLEGAFPIVFKP